MSITDELRGFIEVEAPCYEVATLLAIANRIDEHHAEAQRRWMAELDAAREQSFNAGFDDGFASADDWLAQHEDAMREHGWVKLPKDADGKPIRIGDVMESGDGDVFVVSSVDYGRHSSHGYGKFWMLWSDDADFYELAYECRHHKQPTVEDVLRDMLDAWGELPSNATNEAIVAEYASKLRLAGDGE